jgi:hypothetical protein
MTASDCDSVTSGTHQVRFAAAVTLLALSRRSHIDQCSVADLWVATKNSGGSGRPFLVGTAMRYLSAYWN